MKIIIFQIVWEDKIELIPIAMDVLTNV